MKTKTLKLCAVMLAVSASGFVQTVSAMPGAGHGGGTTANKPKPSIGDGLVARLEAKLGRALTDSEKKEIGDAVKTFEQKLLDANIEAVNVIATALNISVAQAKAALQSPNPLEALAKILGAKPTKEQADAVRAALKARFEAKRAAEKELCDTLVSITGLTPEELHDVLAPPHGGGCDHSGSGGPSSPTGGGQAGGQAGGYGGGPRR